MALLADFTVRHLQPDDVAPMEAMVTVFGEAFNEVDTIPERVTERDT
jgi:hypothetical protein